jgi:anti-sigma regulatory factor (Ser/Thr protein kinase)
MSRGKCGGAANQPPPASAPAPARGDGHITAPAVSGSGVPEDEMRPGFRMTIGADRGEIAKINAAFAEFADAHGLPASVRRSVHVALDELLSNTMAHGFAGRDGGEVTVEAVLRTDRVCVTITDDARPFDPFGMAAPDTALPAEERGIGGLGIHLVRRIMDEVSYHRRADRNVVVLTKRLTPG